MNARRLSRPHLLASLIGAGILMVAAPALADSIYLKSGRVIRTADARVEDGRVVFDQFGFEQSIPMSVVDRVEEDDFTGPEPLPSPPPREARATGEPGDEPASGSGEAAQARPPATPEIETVEAPPYEEEVQPEETRQYWQERVLALGAEEQILGEQLDWLRRVERAFLFSHRSTADVKQRIEAVQQRLAEVDQARRDLREEARRKGIPPGWLRL